jgi:hypothetical protein
MQAGPSQLPQLQDACGSHHGGAITDNITNIAKP